uniref:Uncharacterized protein n=1 Tax=Physcomitrium patens TaxID=3218 RepID=A0A2K1L2H7_PHYPA|nr:hypothetical protein PHYPA_003019 [Physcomitrium patens]
MCLEMVKNLNLKGLEEVCHVWAHVVESEEAGGEEEAAALLGGQDVQAAVPMNTTRQSGCSSLNSFTTLSLPLLI